MNSAKLIEKISNIDILHGGLLLMAGGIAVLIFAYKNSAYSKNKREYLLTYKLKKELGKNRNQEKYFWFKNYFEQLYLPSYSSVLSVLGGGIILFFLARMPIIESFPVPLDYINGNHYQNLIAVHAGIGSIIFALLIFIAESLRDDETKDRARVLLKESFLFPLTVAEIVGFFVFIWGDVNIFSILTPLVMALLTVASLWRLLLVLLSKPRFAEKRLLLLKDRIKKSIDLAISERFGNAVLFDSMGEDKTELNYSPFSIDANEKSNRYCFYADKKGIIVDIRLNKLDEFAKKVENQANENNLSFYKDKAKQLGSIAGSGSVTAETNTERFQQADRQFLHKKFRDEVNEDDQLLISIEKRVIKDPEILKQLVRLVKESFVIKRQGNFSEEIKLEIDGLKDQFIGAIEAKKLGKIEELMKIYINLSEAFLEALNMYGGGYSYEQARKERNSIAGGWNEIRWLSESIREILIKATQSHDQEIIRNIAYLPVSIAIRAIKAGDQYVYQEFLRFPSLLYWLGLKEEDQELQRFMVDRSWRHLKEMSDYYIEYKIKRELNDVGQIKKYKDFTIPIFVAFQGLLKMSFDKGDFGGFQEFLDQFSKVYVDFSVEGDHPNAKYLRESLKWIQDLKEQERVRGNIEIQDEKESAAKDIYLKKQQVIFGLSAWIFEKYRNMQTSDTLKSFYLDISDRLPNTLPELTELYVSSRQFETEHFWSWDDWEIIPDSGVMSIDFHSKLDRLYCVRALSILGRLDEEEIDLITLPHSRDLVYMAEDRPNANTLMNILDGMLSKPGEWNFVLSQVNIEKIVIFKNLLIRTKEAQERAEEKYLEEAKISQAKVEEFKKKIKESFYQSGYLRPVLIAFDAYEDLMGKDPNKEIASWGYNQIDEKGAFIENWHVHYSGWGENYGRGMAGSEDRIILEKILAGAGKQRKILKKDIISEIKKIINGNKLKNPVILQTLDHMYEYDYLRKSEFFISRDDINCPKDNLNYGIGYMGVLKVGDRDVKIIHIFIGDGGMKNKVIVADLHAFGILKQYLPIDESEDGECLYDIFSIRISDLGQDKGRREKIIYDNPVWLKEYKDGEGYLKRKVLLNVYERFEFKIKDQKMAQSFSVE